MGFGGAVGAMITSLKNNKHKRPSAFKKMEGYEHNLHTELQFNKTANQKQLDEIKEKLQQENRKRTIRNILLFSIAISILIYFIGFYKY